MQRIELEKELEILYELVSIEELEEELQDLEKDLSFYKEKNILGIGDSNKKQVFLDEISRLKTSVKFLQNRIETLSQKI